MTVTPPQAAPTARGEPAIDMREVVVRYGRRRAVDGLTLCVPRGSIFGLLGANGAGKTSTIKALLGFRTPASGSAAVLGHDITRERLEINARIGYVSETNSLYGGLAYPQLCAFFRATSRTWDQGAVDRYVGTFGLPTNQPVRRFSKGMKTQMALCLALGSEPDLLILDEPTSGLDPIARRAFLNMLVGDVAAAGKTVFFSSHILSDVETVADSVAVLDKGRLVVSGELDALRQQNANVRVSYAQEPDEQALASMRHVPGVLALEREGRNMRVRVRGDVEAAVTALRTLAPAEAVETTHLSLDDLFLSYVQEGRA
jgi:ABC-2 type transport system ATP-binding protein